eukprot:s138_g35.t1
MIQGFVMALHRARLIGTRDMQMGLSSWGSNLLGQASEQLGPAAAAAAASIRSGVKEVKKSVKENLGTVPSFTSASFSGQSHHLQGVNGTPARDVTEVAFLAEGAFGAVMKVSCNRTAETFALKKISCMEGVQVASSFDAAEREAKLCNHGKLSSDSLLQFGGSSSLSFIFPKPRRFEGLTGAEIVMLSRQAGVLTTRFLQNGSRAWRSFATKKFAAPPMTYISGEDPGNLEANL